MGFDLSATQYYSILSWLQTILCCHDCQLSCVVMSANYPILSRLSTILCYHDCQLLCIAMRVYYPIFSWLPTVLYYHDCQLYCVAMTANYPVLWITSLDPSHQGEVNNRNNYYQTMAELLFQMFWCFSILLMARHSVDLLFGGGVGVIPMR